MRIITWNCQGGFSKKKQFIYAKDPDICVIQECSQESALSCRADGYSVIWEGANEQLGMAIIAEQLSWELTPLGPPAAPSRHKLLIPAVVNGASSFLLVGVWTQEGDSRKENYVVQAYRAIEERPDWFKGRDVMLCGDFNSNVEWDSRYKGTNHTAMVALLDSHQLHSAYHHHMREDHGAESKKTYFQNRRENKPYHIDYTFLPKSWRVTNVEVGSYAEWSKSSDHSPIITDCEPPNLS